MKGVEFAEGAVIIDAALIAKELGLDPALVIGCVRMGQLTALYERGIAEDAGRCRLTFSYRGRRLRLIVADTGQVL
jgi:hypothetical protein